MQLLDSAVAIEQRPLQGDLAVQAVEIANGAVMVLGDHLGAGTVKAHRIAERDVEVQ